MPKISVRVSDEVHAAVRVRAFREGVTLDALGREWFERYADGGLAAGEPPGRERMDSGVGAVSPQTDSKTSTDPVGPRSSAPAASPSFRPDPKGGK